MALAFDAVANSGLTPSFPTSPVTWSHTCAGSDRLLLVGIGIINSTADPTTVKYNGVSLTLIRKEILGSNTVSLWYLIAPTVGTNTIEVSFTGSPVGLTGGSISLTGADQANPVDANNGANGNSTTPSVDVTTIADNCWVVDAVNVDNSGSTFTVGAGQIQRYNVNNTNSAMRDAGSHEGPKSPAGAVTMSWTRGAAAVWEIVAASIKPAAGGTNFTQTLTDVVTIVDVLIKSPQKLATEAMPIADSVRKSISRVFAEILIAIDSLASQLVVTKVLAEVLAMTDSISKQGRKILLDVLSIVDITVRSASRIFQEVVVVVETAGKQIVRAFTEIVTPIDVAVSAVSVRLISIGNFILRSIYALGITIKNLVASPTISQSSIAYIVKSKTESSTLTEKPYTATIRINKA